MSEHTTDEIRQWSDRELLVGLQPYLLAKFHDMEDEDDMYWMRLEYAQLLEELGRRHKVKFDLF